jgi:antitoxin MazE
MQVAKWGNSLAVRLPATLVKELGLQVGDELKLKQAVRQKGQVSELLVARVPSKLEILAGVRELELQCPKTLYSIAMRPMRDEVVHRQQCLNLLDR